MMKFGLLLVLSAALCFVQCKEGLEGVYWPQYQSHLLQSTKAQSELKSFKNAKLLFNTIR